MPKHKPKRSAPTLDMTAMCDVAFLLLTFFMLTAKMKPTEQVPVDTPTSISETKLPDVGTCAILVGKEGDVYLDMVGAQTRRALITEMNSSFSLGLNAEEINRFVNIGGIGCSRQNLKKFLTMDAADKADLAKLTFEERTKRGFGGIPIDTADINKSELADWLHRSRTAQFNYKKKRMEEGDNSIKDYAYVVKADKDTPYPAIRKVINTLTDIGINKFNLITSQEGKPGGEE